MNVAMNKKGYTSFDEVLAKGKTALSVDEFETAAEETGALILDTRNAAEFYKGFIPQSINIGLKGDFCTLGWKHDCRCSTTYSFGL